LCGNHDVYTGYANYAHVLDVLKQPGRYFAIRNPTWTILCLDTTSASETLTKNDGAVDDGQLDWLRGQLAASAPERTILITHHFITSDWDPTARRLAQAVPPLLRGPVAAWYWGHEHRLAAYGPSRYMERGACIGNAVFLEKFAPPHRRTSTFADDLCHCGDAGTKYWSHGFLELELTPTEIRERFRTEAQGWER
jgi:3',5'-cyclic AMP phosphodiesterase CpdA